MGRGAGGGRGTAGRAAGAAGLRMQRQNAKPATEKQRVYTQDLLDSMKQRSVQLAAEGQTPGEPRFEYPFERYWELARLPNDLTSWEASGLIDELRNANPRGVFNDAQRAVHSRLAGQRLFLGTQQSILALEEASQYVADLERAAT